MSLLRNRRVLIFATIFSALFASCENHNNPNPEQEQDAAVESESTFICTLGIEEENLDKPQPKKMIFNRPFYVLLKRTDTDNPYFVLWAANPDLMVKE